MNNLIKLVEYIELYYFFNSPKKAFPEGREQFSFSNNNNNNEAVIFGGVCSNKSNKVWKLNPINYTWIDLEFQSKTVINRFGHTAILYLQKLYIFGGKAKVGNVYIFQDLEIFDIEKKLWIYPNINSKIQMKLRRGHIALLIGKNNNK